MRFEGYGDIPERLQTVRLQTIRLTVWLAAYTPLTAGGMAAGDSSTTLEMTGRFVVPPLAGERWYAVPKGDGIGLMGENIIDAAPCGAWVTLSF